MYIRYIEMNELRMQNSFFFSFLLRIDKNILIIMIVIVIIGIFILELYFLKNGKWLKIFWKKFYRYFIFENISLE